jgi:DNA polymerase III subunit delta'
MDLLGQPTVVSAVTHALRMQRLAHAVLFCGPDGVGREHCARGVAAALLCERSVLPFGCGGCRSCKRAWAGQHPDLVEVMSEAEAQRRGRPSDGQKASRDIRVDEIRALNAVLQQRPYEGRSRVVIIVEAQMMNERAQNALLKSLEEPVPGNHIFLIIPHARSLLPTIASRSQQLAFRPLTPEVVAEILRRRQVPDADGRARGATSMSAALADPATGATAIADGLSASTSSDALAAAEAAGKDRGEVLAAIHQSWTALGEQLRLDAHAGQLAAIDEGLAKLHALAVAEERLDANVAVPLSLEAAFLSLQRVGP